MPNGDGAHPLVYDRFSFAYKGGDRVVRDASVELTEGKVVLVTGRAFRGVSAGWFCERAER